MRKHTLTRVIAFCLTLAMMLSALPVTSLAAFDEDTINHATGVKNVILMIGDGMGENHVQAAGMTNLMSIPNKTYCTTRSTVDVTDSAAAATALATGVKTTNSYVGLNSSGTAVTNLVEYAQNLGMKTGVVATEYIYHATPAGFTAHDNDRYHYNAIARDQILSGTDVMMGGGSSIFNSYQTDIQEAGYTYIHDTNDLNSLPTSGKVLAAFGAGAIQTVDGNGNSNSYPKLSAMTQKALALLENENGFFLMVEGSDIDSYSHQGKLNSAILEAQEFDNAIKTAMDYVDAHGDTLLIVTADHETGGLQRSGGSWTFTSGDHTSTNVPVYFYYGKYASSMSLPDVIDNTEIHDYIEKSLANYTGSRTPGGTKTPESKTVFFRNTANWSEVYLYAWSYISNNKVEPLGPWPGTKMTAGADGIYSYSTSNDLAEKTLFISDDIKFHDGSGNRTEDITADIQFGKVYGPDGSVVDVDAPTTYTVSISPTTNGSVTASSYSAAANTTITLTVSPSSGYKLSSLTVTDSMGNTVSLSGSGSTRTFTMPASNVTVTAAFEKDSTDPDPEYNVIYFVDNQGWGSVYLYAFNSSDPNGTTLLGKYPGTKMAKVDGYDNLYSYTDISGKLSETRDTIKFSNGVTSGSNHFRTDNQKPFAFGTYYTQGTVMSTGSSGTKWSPATTTAPTPASYTVTVLNDGNGTASASPASAPVGTTVTLTATANSGYVFKEWQVISGGVTITDNQFVMPAGNVTVKAVFEAAKYNVYAMTDGGGTVTASPSYAAPGTEITLTATPGTGYHFQEWQVISGGVTITGNQFIMPARNVTVKGVFESDTSATYTLTFVTNGGSAIADVTKNSGETVDLSGYIPTREHFTFEGWYSDSGLTNKVTSVTLDQDKTVYAKWTENTTETGCVFYFQKPDHWGTVYIYLWDQSSGSTIHYTGDWPGTQMTEVPDCNGLYTYTYPGTDLGANALVVFNAGIGGEQTVDIDNANQSNKVFRLTVQRDGKWDVDVNDAIVADDGHVAPNAIYFVNSENWSPVYLHYWGSNVDNTTYPGVEMTQVAGSLYKFVDAKRVLAHADGMKINNNSGARETLTINAPDIKYGATYSLNGKSSNNQWNYAVSGGVLASKFANETAFGSEDVYLAVLLDSSGGLPGEPARSTFRYAGSNGSYKVAYLDNNEPKYSTNSVDVIDSEIYGALVPSVNGDGTKGIVDVTGAAILPYIQSVDWDAFLQGIAAYNQTAENQVIASDGTVIDSNNYTRYRVVPYVIKHEVGYSKGWHIDCRVMPESYVSLQYNLNLPEGETVGSDLSVPHSEDMARGSTKMVGSVMDGSRTVAVKDTITTTNGTTLYFQGWKDSLGQVYLPGDNITLQDNTTLYAIWTKVENPTYSVTYVFRSGTENVSLPTTGMPAAPAGADDVSGSYSVDATVYLPVNEKIGDRTYVWVFNGWYTDEAMNTPAASTLSVSENITLYGKWLRWETFTITYTDGVENEEVFADQVTENLLSGDATPAFDADPNTDGNQDPTRTGFVFAGWDPAVAATVTGNATYTATWEVDRNGNGVADKDETKYTVTYTDGVENEVVFADQTTENLLSGDATPAFDADPNTDGNQDPTRTGFVFAGWDPAVAATVTGNATYTAQWQGLSIVKQLTEIRRGENIVYSASSHHGIPSAQVGDILTYTITVRNTGNVSLGDIRVADTMMADNDSRTPNLSKSVINGLSVGAEEEILVTYVVKDMDAGKVLTNTAAAYIGEDKVGEDSAAPVSVKNQYTVTYEWDSSKPANFTGTLPSAVTVNEGDSYTVSTQTYDNVTTDNGIYLFLGWFDGNGAKQTTLENINRDMTLYGKWSFQEFAKATVKVEYALYNADGTVLLRTLADTGASVTGKVGTPYDLSAYKPVIIALDGDTFVFQSQSSDAFTGTIPEGGLTITRRYWKVEIRELTVEKTVSADSAKVGDQLTYTIKITNSGNVDLTDITVTDEMLNESATIIRLSAGEAVTFQYPYVVPADSAGKTITNIVDAKASDGTAGTASCTTQIEESAPDLPLLDKGNHVAYIIGYEDGTIRPDATITRAEVATIFFRLMTDEARNYYWCQTNPFTDVPASAWYNNAVSTLNAAGLILDIQDGMFLPNQPITRAEFSVMAAKFTKMTASTQTSSFIDVPSDHWAAAEIALIEQQGWIKGDGNGYFRPDATITRAEAMAIVNRMLERAVEKEHMIPTMIQWADNPTANWYYEDVQEATNSHTFVRLTKQVPGENYFYEEWQLLLTNPNWAELEKSWRQTNSK